MVFQRWLKLTRRGEISPLLCVLLALEDVARLLTEKSLPTSAGRGIQIYWEWNRLSGAAMATAYRKARRAGESRQHNTTQHGKHYRWHCLRCGDSCSNERLDGQTLGV